MALKQHSTHTALKAQETQPKTIELSTGEIVPVPEGADPEAYRRYAEALVQHKTRPAQRKTRQERGCPNGRTNYAERVLWRRNGHESYVPKAPVEPATELADAMVIIHSAGGVTTISRNGEVSYD